MAEDGKRPEGAWEPVGGRLAKMAQEAETRKEAARGQEGPTRVEHTQGDGGSYLPQPSRATLAGAQSPLQPPSPKPLRVPLAAAPPLQPPSLGGGPNGGKGKGKGKAPTKASSEEYQQAVKELWETADPGSTAFWKSWEFRSQKRPLKTWANCATCT